MLSSILLDQVKLRCKKACVEDRYEVAVTPYTPIKGETNIQDFVTISDMMQCELFQEDLTRTAGGSRSTCSSPPPWRRSVNSTSSMTLSPSSLP